MSNLIYLLVAAAVSAVGVFVLWLRHRPTTSAQSTIEEFNHKMKALSPENEPGRNGRRTSRGA